MRPFKRILTSFTAMAIAFIPFYAQGYDIGSGDEFHSGHAYEDASTTPSMCLIGLGAATTAALVVAVIIVASNGSSAHSH